MKIALRRWTVRVLGLLLLTVLSACLVPDGGYVGSVYVSPGYDYGGWGRGYHVGPPRGRAVERRPETLSPPRAYRPAPQSRPAPSIPERPRKH